MSGRPTGPAGFREHERARVDLADLYWTTTDPCLESMTILDEIAARFPEAVSFAAGPSFASFLDSDELRRRSEHRLQELGWDEQKVRRPLLQDGQTKGIMPEAVARNLAAAGIDVNPEAIVVTVGRQEAMSLVLRALRAHDRDVVFAVAPLYVGLTVAARLVQLRLRHVRGGETGLDLADLAARVRLARAEGLRPRACYVIPDFANPAGLSLPETIRRQLLELAERENLLILEDNPFGLVGAGKPHPPALKALDCTGRVVYLGSLAEGALPGARVGFVIADQTVTHGGRVVGLLADQIANVRSMLALDVAPVAPAGAAAATVVEHDGSLVAANAGKSEVYRRNLRLVLDGLARRFPAGGGHGVHWNVPAGGNFVVITLPFEVDDALLERSARDFGVLWTPMRHFYDGGGPYHQLWLSYSRLSTEEIEVGLDRLAAMIASGRPAAPEAPSAPAPRADPDNLPRSIVADYLTLVDDSCVAILPHALRIAAGLRIADLLADGPADAGRVAGAIGANADAVYRLLRALATVGFVAETAPHTFALCAAGHRLRSDSRDSVRESVANLDSPLAWTRAMEAFRTGRPVPISAHSDEADGGFFGHKESHADANRAFTQRMSERAARCYDQVVPAVDWSRSSLVLDVGGGDGFLLGQVLRRNQWLSGILFDRESVVMAAKDADRLGDVADRCRLVGGDFFERIPPGADTHLMCSVLHDWPDEQAAAILARSREALVPGGRLLIVEMLVPPDDGWHPSKWSDLGMMVLTGGRERTEAEYRELLSRAGWAVSAVRDIPESYFSLIEVEPGPAGAVPTSAGG